MVEATYSDSVERTYEFIEFWTGGQHGRFSTYVEFIVTFHYPDAPDEPVRVRISKDGPADQWWLRILNFDGTYVTHLVPIDHYKAYGLDRYLAGGSVTSGWVRAFYGD